MKGDLAILDALSSYCIKCGDKTPQRSCRVAVQDKMIETG